MERVGFVGDELSDAVQAFTQQVDGKKKIEGLELSPALQNPGIGAGIRRVQALNRMDIPQLWRAVIRSGSKKSGPIISVLPPKGIASGDAATHVTGAGLYAPEMAANAESFDCSFPTDTPAESLVQFAATAVRAFGYTGDLQWTVRERGLLPR